MSRKAKRLTKAIEEFFDWISEEEIKADEGGDHEESKAYARASSKLGLILIRKKVYRPV